MQKIIPFLWFDNNTEAALNFYTSLFPNSKIKSVQKYPEGIDSGPMKDMAGKVITAEFNLAGYDFMALDGGPLFKFTPAISFSVNCETEEEINKLWEALATDGQIMMEFQEYPFSKKYGWLNDKYGVSWQLSLTGEKMKIVPSFLFVGKQAGYAKEAMQLYTSLFNDAKITTAINYTEGEGDNPKYLKYASFTLENQEFVAMDSGMDHKFNFSEAVSLYVKCADQKEVDYFWDKFINDGGEESQCGWLKDKYGVSWQIVPDILGELLSNSDKVKAGRVLQAMLKMQKLDVDKLQNAFDEK